MKRHPFANTARPTLDERWLYGLHAVGSWLRQSPQSVRVLRVADAEARSAAVSDVVRLARAAGVVVETSTPSALFDLTGTRRHQGVAARCDPFPYVDIEDVLALNARLLLVLDHLQDPHNFGAILRSCAAVGCPAVILPRDGTVGMTPVVEAAAAGTAALLRICRVTNLVRTMETLKESGYWTVGLAASAKTDLYATQLPERVALVLGGEAGLRRLVHERCDLHVSIPMSPSVESLNASVAAAVTLFEIRRRWKGVMHGE